jgi:hypothetical protein
MNKTNIILGSVFLGALTLLGACTPAATPQIGNEQTVQSTVSAVNNQTAAATAKPTEATPPPALTASQADLAAYNGAMKLDDQSYCEKIADEDYRGQCVSDLSNRLLLKTALENKDAALCEKMSNTDQQQACRTQVEVKLQSKEMEQQKLEAISVQESAMKAALDSSDLSACTKLDNQNARTDCELNILINLAQSSQSAEPCSRASSEGLRQACEEEYRQIGQAD